MKIFYFIIFIVIMAGCRKSSSYNYSSVNPTSLQGVWVEKSLRVDTLDFDTPVSIFGDSTVFFNSKTYWDYSYSTSAPIINSAIYDYYISGDSIHLYSYYSSCWKCYVQYWFKMNNNQTRFQIGKFYRRNSLSDIVEFERIK